LVSGPNISAVKVPPWPRPPGARVLLYRGRFKHKTRADRRLSIIKKKTLCPRTQNPAGKIVGQGPGRWGGRPQEGWKRTNRGGDPRGGGTSPRPGAGGGYTTKPCRQPSGARREFFSAVGLWLGVGGRSSIGCIRRGLRGCSVMCRISPTRGRSNFRRGTRKVLISSNTKAAASHIGRGGPGSRG